MVSEKLCTGPKRKWKHMHTEIIPEGYAAKRGYAFWEKEFDGMAYKTMLRQLISKWGIMSIDNAERNGI